MKGETGRRERLIVLVTTEEKGKLDRACYLLNGCSRSFIIRRLVNEFLGVLIEKTLRAMKATATVAMHYLEDRTVNDMLKDEDCLEAFSVSCFLAELDEDDCWNYNPATISLDSPEVIKFINLAKTDFRQVYLRACSSPEFYKILTDRLIAAGKLDKKYLTQKRKDIVEDERLHPMIDDPVMKYHCEHPIILGIQPSNVIPDTREVSSANSSNTDRHTTGNAAGNLLDSLDVVSDEELKVRPDGAS